MEPLILGHIIGDFYIQTNHVAFKKKQSFWYMLLHCFLYTVVMCGTLTTCLGSFIQGVKVAIIIGSSHILVDSIKLKIKSNYVKAIRYEYILFLIDQILHIIILFFICSIFPIDFQREKYILLSLGHGIRLQKAIVIVIAGLICWKPTVILISLVFKVIPKTVEEADYDKEEYVKAAEVKKVLEKPMTHENIDNNKEVLRIGSWIGILEREIILLLGLLGQYGAIGFVLTAKSLARYKQLENKAFAEKYLVGTLLSSFIAIACVLICSLI